MKLLTHNLLTSRCIAGVKEGYPLKIEATKIVKNQIEHNADFVTRILPKINWSVLKLEASKFEIDLPEENPVTIVANNKTELPADLSKKIHDALLGVEIIEGALVCPETDHRFTIKNGIPNMLINEDQV